MMSSTRAGIACGGECVRVVEGVNMLGVEGR